MFFICRIYSLCITSKSVALAPSLMKSYLEIDKIASSFWILEVAILPVWKEVQSRNPAKLPWKTGLYMELRDLEEPFGGSPFSVHVTEVRLPAHWDFWREIWWKLQISHQSSYKMDHFPVEKGSQERARVTMTCTTKVSNTSTRYWYTVLLVLSYSFVVNVRLSVSINTCI